MLMLIARKFIKDNIDTNLNTSHVNVNLAQMLPNLIPMAIFKYISC